MTMRMAQEASSDSVDLIVVGVFKHAQGRHAFDADALGRKCVCNALMANIGLGQIHNGSELEKPLITSGDDVTTVARFLKSGARSYRAVDVIEYLLGDTSVVLSG